MESDPTLAQVVRETTEALERLNYLSVDWMSADQFDTMLNAVHADILKNRAAEKEAPPVNDGIIYRDVAMPQEVEYLMAELAHWNGMSTDKMIVKCCELIGANPTAFGLQPIPSECG